MTTLTLLALGCASQARSVPPVEGPAALHLPTTSAAPRLVLPRDFDAAPALPVPSETRCYRFDQPYFHEVRAAVPGQGVTTADTGAFARMQAEIRAALRERGVEPDPFLAYFADSTRLEVTTVVRLEPGPADTLRPAAGRLRLSAAFILPEVTRVDSQGRLLFSRRGAFWRVLPGDSVEIAWDNEWAHGPRVRAAFRADSLLGTLVHQSSIRRDSITGRIVPPTPRPVHAVRVACLLPSGPV